MQASPFANYSCLRTLLCAALTALLLAACNAQIPEEAPGKVAQTQSSSSSEITQARQRWVATGIHNYQFTLSRVCFCASEDAMRVVVKKGRAISVHYIPGGQTVNAERLKSIPTSINALFDAMESNSADPKHRVTWQLNEEYHYPEVLRIDYDLSGGDASESFSVRDFSH